MNSPAKTIEPGVYPNVPEEEYFGWPAVSNSRLQPLLKSPAHCRYAMDHPTEPTPAMILGSAVDCLVFDPTAFIDKFDVSRQCEAMTQKKARCSKNGTRRISATKIWPEGDAPDGIPEELVQWFCSTHADPMLESSYDLITVLSQETSDTAYDMAKAVVEHPGASVLLDACDETQLSLVWKENGLLCKGRLDGLSRELKTVIDLKTCQDASPEAFSRKIADFSYHRQAAMYMRGCSFHGIEVQNYVIIAVESEPPYAVALYTLTERKPIIGFGAYNNPSPVEYGDRGLLRLLELYGHCEETGDWPGYEGHPVPISLPGYVMAKVGRE